MAIQTLIDKINALIRRNLAVKNRINDKDIGSKSWWSIVNSITGWKSTHVSISSIVNPDEINDYFCTINTDPDYIDPEILSIPDGTRIPEVTSLTFFNFLLNLKRTTAGPDQLLFWLWRDFAFDPAPIICHVFNCLLRCQTVPTLWKMADIMPLPKETPFRTCNQLRPILLTNIIMLLIILLVLINLCIAKASILPWPWLSASMNGLDSLIVMLTLFVVSHFILVRHLILSHIT